MTQRPLETWSHLIWSQSRAPLQSQSLICLDSNFMVKISPNGKNKVTFITQPKKVLLVNVTLFLLFDHFLTIFQHF